MNFEGNQIKSGVEDQLRVSVLRVAEPLSVADVNALHYWAPSVRTHVLSLLEDNDALSGRFSSEVKIDHLVSRPQQSLRGNVVEVRDMLPHSHVGITMLMANESRESATGLMHPLLCIRFLRSEFAFFKPFISKDKLPWFEECFDTIEADLDCPKAARGQAIRLVEELLRQISLFKVLSNWILEFRSKLEDFLNKLKDEAGELQLQWNEPYTWVLLRSDSIHYRIIDNVAQLRAPNPLRVKLFD